MLWIWYPCALLEDVRTAWDIGESERLLPRGNFCTLQKSLKAILRFYVCLTTTRYSLTSDPG